MYDLNSWFQSSPMVNTNLGWLADQDQVDLFENLDSLWYQAKIFELIVWINRNIEEKEWIRELSWLKRSSGLNRSKFCNGLTGLSSFDLLRASCTVLLCFVGPWLLSSPCAHNLVTGLFA